MHSAGTITQRTRPSTCTLRPHLLHLLRTVSRPRLSYPPHHLPKPHRSLQLPRLVPAVESNIQVESMQEKSQVGKVSSAVNHSSFHILTAAHLSIMNCSSIHNAQAILKSLLHVTWDDRHQQRVSSGSEKVARRLAVDGVRVLRRQHMAGKRGLARIL